MAATGLQLEKFPEITVRVKYATEHRCGIVLHGIGLTDNISDTDPLKDGLPISTAKALDDSKQVPGISVVSPELLEVGGAPRLITQLEW